MVRGETATLLILAVLATVGIAYAVGRPEEELTPALGPNPNVPPQVVYVSGPPYIAPGGGGVQGVDDRTVQERQDELDEWYNEPTIYEDYTHDVDEYEQAKIELGLTKDIMKVVDRPAPTEIQAVGGVVASPNIPTAYDSYEERKISPYVVQEPTAITGSGDVAITAYDSYERMRR